jgi:uncharacterized ferritin-like protein (DUF455 family)
MDQEERGREAANSLEARAARVLFGGALSDKLCQEAPPWRGGYLSEAPERPSRTFQLRFQTERERVVGELREARVRAARLHDFANHELQAIELFALMLLRFPDAEQGLRRTWGRILGEEQTHLRLYIERIQALGMEFGELPLSGAFYRGLCGVTSPLQFELGMGLVLEQANLDFAAIEAERFAAAGDLESAAVLRRVHADEVGHVRSAVHYIQNVLPPGTNLWTWFLENAQPPLGPGRARGPRMDRAGRLRAGLGPEFIEALSAHGQSRGRPPQIWRFEAGVEQAACASWTGKKPTTTRVVADLNWDLASVVGVLASQGDIVHLAEAPAVDWAVRLREAGLPAVEWCHDLGTLSQRKLGQELCWGRATDARWLSKAWLVEAIEKSEQAGERLLDAEVPRSRVLRKLEEVQEAVAALTGPHVLKAPYGAAGGAALRLFGAPTQADWRWMERVLAEQGCLVLSPWLARCADFSAHGDINDRGAFRFQGVVRFLADARGAFRGVCTGGALLGLPTALSRVLTGDGQEKDRLTRTARTLLERLTPRLFSEGYRGPLGLDQLVWRTEQVARPGVLESAEEGPFGFHPAVELNTRWSFGRVGLRLRALQAAGSAGVLRLWRVKEGLPRELPPPMVRDGQGKVREGRLFLSDPRRAREVAAVWEVGECARTTISSF